MTIKPSVKSKTVLGAWPNEGERTISYGTMTREGLIPHHVYVTGVGTFTTPVMVEMDIVDTLPRPRRDAKGNLMYALPARRFIAPQPQKFES